MTSRQRALILCAHDDDEAIGPGGTIRKLANAGVAITTVIFASGNEGCQRIEEQDGIVKQRKAECRRAQKILGTAGCISYSYPDFSNLDCEDVYRKVMQAVRLIRPHVVFSHLPTDYLAHRTLSRLVPEAVWQAGWLCSPDLGRPWQVNRLYLFSILELIAKPSHIVDITDTMKAKLQAMQAYRSQQKVVRGIQEQMEAKARAYGSLIGVQYGEAFIRSQAIPVAVAAPMELLRSCV